MNWRTEQLTRRTGLAAGLLLAIAAGAAHPADVRNDTGKRPARFRIEEATIDDMHRAIRDGRTTCHGLVQAYVGRARAYNGMCTRLVTRDGAAIAPASGTVRAGSPLVFPSSTVAVSGILPNFDHYAGLPIEYGRMEATASDSSVSQQYGMVVGMPNARQVNALSTLNLRGERSVSCKAE